MNIIKKSSSSLSKLSLPKTVSEPCNEIGNYTFLVYGERKIGKTSLAGQFENPFFLMCEPGGKGLKAKQVSIPDWETLLEYIALLKKNPSYCKTVVIDTGFMLYERCFEYCLKELKLDDPRDEAWGNGWKHIDREFRKAHDEIFSLPVGVIITAHSEIKTMKTRGGFEHTKIVTQLGGQASRFYNGVVDIICYYHYDENKNRQLAIRGSADLDAGTRTSGKFLYTDGTPIENIPMGKNEKEAYNNLVLAFNNNLKKAGNPAGGELKKKIIIGKK